MPRERQRNLGDHGRGCFAGWALAPSQARDGSLFGIEPVAALFCALVYIFDLFAISLRSYSIERDRLMPQRSISVECDAGNLEFGIPFVFTSAAPNISITTLEGRALRGHRHQRRHIAPKVETPEVPPRLPDPLLRPAHVLDHERDEVSSRFDGLALDAKARLEKRIVRRRESLRPRPGHRTIAVGLAGW